MSSHLMRHLEWMNDHPGHVFDGLPWEHQSYKERLDRLEKEQKALAEKLAYSIQTSLIALRCASSTITYVQLSRG